MVTAMLVPVVDGPVCDTTNETGKRGSQEPRGTVLSMWTRNGSDVDPNAALELLTWVEASCAVPLDPRNLRSLYRTVIEAMSNAASHGGNGAAWVLTATRIRSTSSRNYIRFLFADTGCGIVMRLRSLAPQTSQAPIQDAEVLRKLLEGHTTGWAVSRTGRGRGLQQLKNDSTEGLLESVVVVTNRAIANVSEDWFSTLPFDLRGTLLAWEVTSEPSSG